MDPGRRITSLKPKSILCRYTGRSPPGRPSQRISSLQTSRRIAKPSQKKNTQPNHTRPASAQQTTFRICKLVLFEAQNRDSTNSDARASNRISSDLLPHTSSEQAPSQAFMHTRGTKRPAADDEFALRSELALGGDVRIITHGGSGMLGAAAEVFHSGVDMMVGYLTHARNKLWSLLEHSTPNTDGGNVCVKRIKLSDDGHNDGRNPGSVRWRGEPVNGRTNSQLQDRKRLAAGPSRLHQSPIVDEQTRRFPNTETSTVGTFTSPVFMAGSYPVEDSLDNASTRAPATSSTNREKRTENSPGPRTTQPLAAGHSAFRAGSIDPRTKSKIFSSLTKPKPKSAGKSHLSFGSVARSLSNNDGASSRLSSSEAAHPVVKDEADGKRDSLECSDGANHRESPQPLTSLTVFDNSKGILDTAEAFGELKISGTVVQREERERQAREREEKLERQRAEQERQQEEEKRRLQEEELRREAEEQRQREEAERRGGLRQPNRDLFPALTAEWTARVQESLLPGNGDLAETPEAKLKCHDFERLVPSTVWLNDNIVNGTLLWLDRYINEAAGITDVRARTRKCLMPGSFFFTRLLDHGVRGTERTLRRLGVNKDNILDIETILMPICQVNHWTLVVVEPQKRRISHFDSLNPAGSDGKRALAKDWVKSILGDAFVDEEWSFAKYKAPRQTNGWDCGVHTVLNGVCLGLGIEPSAAYSSDQLPDLRKSIAAILLNEGFKGEFSLAGC